MTDHALRADRTHRDLVEEGRELVSDDSCGCTGPDCPHKRAMILVQSLYNTEETEE